MSSAVLGCAASGTHWYQLALGTAWAFVLPRGEYLLCAQEWREHEGHLVLGLTAFCPSAWAFTAPGPGLGNFLQPFNLLPFFALLDQAWQWAAIGCPGYVIRETVYLGFIPSLLYVISFFAKILFTLA